MLSRRSARELNGLIEGPEAPVADARVRRAHPGRPARGIPRRQHVDASGLLVADRAIIIGSRQGITWLLFGFVPAIIGFGAYWIRSIVQSLRYSIAPTPDGVRITFGLLTTVTEIVPPGRVHAVEVSQPILWRPAGWWMVRINRLTGRSASDASTDQFTTVLPVGTAADVERVLRLLQPSAPDEEWALIVRQGMFGPGEDDTFTDTPRRAWWIRPLSFRRNGFRVTADALLLRRGFIWRTLVILPLARLQSIALYQGPVARTLGVTSVRAHVVTGPVSRAGGIDRVDALRCSTTSRAARCAKPRRSLASVGRGRGGAGIPARRRAGDGREDADEPRRQARRRDHRRRSGRTGARGRPGRRRARTHRHHAGLGPGTGRGDPAGRARARRARGRPAQRARRSSPCRTTSSRVSWRASPRSARGSRGSSSCTPTPPSAPRSFRPPSRGAIPLAVHPAIAFTGTSMDLRPLASAYAAVTAPAPCCRSRRRSPSSWAASRSSSPRPTERRTRRRSRS